MKKGKYIDYNILLACLSQKSSAKNALVQQVTETIPDHKSVSIFPATSQTLRVA
jgi:hypothetical protein